LLHCRRAKLQAAVKAKRAGLKGKRQQWGDDLSGDAAKLAGLRDELLRLQGQTAFARALANNQPAVSKPPDVTRGYLAEKSRGAASHESVDPNQRAEVVDGTITALRKALDRSRGKEDQLREAADAALKAYAADKPPGGLDPEAFGAAVVLAAVSTGSPRYDTGAADYEDVFHQGSSPGALQDDVAALKLALAAVDAEEDALKKVHDAAGKYIAAENRRLGDAVNSAKGDLQRLASGADIDRDSARESEAKAANDLLSALKHADTDAAQSERTLGTKVDGLERDNAQLERELTDLRALLEAERATASAGVSDLAGAGAESDRLRAEIEELKAKAVALERKLAHANTETETAQAEAAQHLKENRALKQKLRDAENDLESLRADLARALAELKRLKDNILVEDLEGALAAARVQLRDTDKKNRELGDNVQDLREQLSAALARPTPPVQDDSLMKEMERKLAEARRALHEAESKVPYCRPSCFHIVFAPCMLSVSVCGRGLPEQWYTSIAPPPSI
jgi:hypothetical protein